MVSVTVPTITSQGWEATKSPCMRNSLVNMVALCSAFPRRQEVVMSPDKTRFHPFPFIQTLDPSTEGRGFESSLCQGLSLAGSRCSDIIGPSLQGRGGGLSNLRSPLQKAPWAPGVTAIRLKWMRLGEGVSLYGITRSCWGRQGRGVCGGSKIAWGGN